MYYWHANCTKIVGTCLMTHNFLSLQFVFIIEYARGTCCSKVPYRLLTHKLQMVVRSQRTCDLCRKVKNILTTYHNSVLTIDLLSLFICL